VELRLEAESPAAPNYQLDAPCSDGVLQRYIQGGRYIVSMASLDADGAELRVSHSESVSSGFPLMVQRTFVVP
jgi:hypothetical protein